MYHVFNYTLVEGQQKYCLQNRNKSERMDARERENRREIYVGGPRERVCGESAIDVSAVVHKERKPSKE